MRTEIVIASNNLHKIREFRAILKSVINIDITSLLNFPDYTPPEELGATFEENAKLKAEHAAKTLGKWVIADDSGLVVPALKGDPGVRSRRYAGNDATDSENRKKLLKEMKALNEMQRDAYYECFLVLANPEGIKKSVRGVCEGTIIQEEKGCYGFGYDSIFRKHEYNDTFAQLEDSIKNRISHRKKAVEKILPTLETI